MAEVKDKGYALGPKSPLEKVIADRTRGAQRLAARSWSAGTDLLCSRKCARRYRPDHYPTHSNAQSSHYRPDIDGLRAVAVALVLLYHLDPQIFPNGYIGVDIFFVISGYVVTLSTLARGDISDKDALFTFWKRRSLRILPALLICCLVILIVSVCLLPSYPLVVFNSIVRTGVSAIFGLGNLYLMRSRLDYFSADQSFNPFLHTWSLGVEEQYYFLFSLVFIAIPLALAPSGALRAKALLWMRVAIMGVFSIVSILLLVRTNETEPLASYYLLTYRFWELGVGSLLALVLSRSAGTDGRDVLDFTRLPSVALLVFKFVQAGTLGIIALLLFLPLGEGHFSIWGLVAAVAGATVIIFVGAFGNVTRSKLLTSWVMVGVGKRSYSLYLWHWPIFVSFALTVGLNNSIVTVIAALALVLGCASLTYSLVEQPFRLNVNAPSRGRFAVLAALAVAVMGVATWAHVSPGAGYIGLPQSWATDWLPEPDKAYSADGRIVQRNCDLALRSAVPSQVPDECTMRSGTGLPHTLRRRILLIGDSIAFANWGMLVAAAERGAFELKVLGYDGCGIEKRSTAKTESCRRYWSAIPAIVKRELREGDALFVAVLWRLGPEQTHSEAKRILVRAIEAARALRVSIIFQAPLPAFKRASYVCIPEWFRTDFSDCYVERLAFEAARSDVMQLLKSFQNRYSDIHIWDPLLRLCPDARCQQFADKKPLYRDKMHLSYHASSSLGDHFVAFFDAITGRGG